MKCFSTAFLLFLFCSTVAAQTSPIGIIDFYGLRSTDEQKARAVLSLKKCNAALEPKEKINSPGKKIEALSNVARAKFSFVCCSDDVKTFLYVGVPKKDAGVLSFRTVFITDMTHDSTDSKADV
jgi:Outer membrane protein/protective antigen OMA87